MSRLDGLLASYALDGLEQAPGLGMIGALVHLSCDLRGPGAASSPIFQEAGPDEQTVGMKSRVHPTYKTKYRVMNWAAYDSAVVRRGDVTV